jgi:tRNA nucleotidyltransferase (CCA-adding enzyme)
MGVCGTGATVAEAFEQAALALSAVVASLDSVRDRSRVGISLQNDDIELLLVDWLNAIVFEMATRRMLFSRFEVRIDQDRLQASAWGEAVDPQRHEPAVEVKGATLTGLSVKRQADGMWIARCIVDV